MAGMEVGASTREPVMPYYIALTSYISFALFYVFGHARDLWRTLVGGATGGTPPPPKGYAPLCKDYEDFYTRRMYMRIHDVFNRPICSAPDAWIDVVERVAEPGRRASAAKLRCTESSRRCLNLGSYNYLGFAAADPYCTQRVRVHGGRAVGARVGRVSARACVVTKGSRRGRARAGAAGGQRLRRCRRASAQRCGVQGCAARRRARCGAGCAACGGGRCALTARVCKRALLKARLPFDAAAAARARPSRAPRRAPQVLDALVKHGASTCRRARAPRAPPPPRRPPCRLSQENAHAHTHAHAPLPLHARARLTLLPPPTPSAQRAGRPGADARP
jgi:hypothetical protein